MQRPDSCFTAWSKLYNLKVQASDLISAFDHTFHPWFKPFHCRCTFVYGDCYKWHSCQNVYIGFTGVDSGSVFTVLDQCQNISRQEEGICQLTDWYCRLSVRTSTRKHYSRKRDIWKYRFFQSNLLEMDSLLKLPFQSAWIQFIRL